MTLLLALRALPWKLIGYLALGLALAASLAALKIERSHTAKLQAQLTACEQARKADAASYKAAQEQAQRLNIEQVRRVESRQQELNNEASRTLSARLERLRGELRSQGRAPEGHPGSPGSPQAGDPTGTPGETGLCLTPEELLHGASNEERHDELISLIEQAMKLLNEQ